MSAKTSAQPGRRTPLSLTAASKQQQLQQQKEQPQQSQKSSTGSNETQNNSKNDNKTVSINQKTEKAPSESKESLQKDKKQQQNIEKKPQQTSKIPTASLVGQVKKAEKNEEKKTQNGVGNSNGNTKEKQANGKDAKINIKENKEKTEILDKTKSDKEDNDKPEKLEKSSKSDKIEKHIENADKKSLKAEEREKQKDSVNDKDKRKDGDKEEKKQPEREVRAKRGSLENSEKKNQEKQEDIVKQMDVTLSENKPALPITEVNPITPVKPSEESEKSPFNKSTPSKATKLQAAVASPAKSAITIDDVEMEPLCVTPTKQAKPTIQSVAVANQPTATSTPGKKLRHKELSSMQPSTGINSSPQIKGSLPDRNTCPRTFNQISGRRSIRAGTDYTNSYFQKNAQYRESYRRINTELDVTSTTNTSLNVTVGSEVPNNSSFSFFGRGRKRDRTPPYTQSTIDLQNDLELSPKSPKRARIDMYGFFTAVASPLSLLRSRFSKASIQSSTPVKLHPKLAEPGEDDVEVQNVSGISIEEEIPSNEAVADDMTATEEVTAENGDEGTPKKNSSDTKDVNDATEKEAAIYQKCGMEKPIEGIDVETDDIKVTETVTTSDPLSKNKRCIVM